MPTFTVYGHPATKGSTVSFMGDKGKIITRTDCKNLASWSQAVAWAARASKVRRIDPPQGVHLSVTFTFLRPQSASARLYPVVRPDLDKNLRALLDSLTGVAYHDDSQVCNISAMKVYGAEASTTITIEALRKMQK